jgi:tRNA pseudouridine38/39 synthase
VFDITKFEQRSVVLQLMYVGWSYQGFARQANSDNTIEVCSIFGGVGGRLLQVDTFTARRHY